MRVDDVVPTSTVEDVRVAEVRGGQSLGLVDLLFRDDHASEVLHHDVLEPEEHGVAIERSRPGLEVGVHLRRAAWVLVPVSELVADLLKQNKVAPEATEINELVAKEQSWLRDLLSVYSGRFDVIETFTKQTVDHPQLISSINTDRTLPTVDLVNAWLIDMLKLIERQRETMVEC